MRWTSIGSSLRFPWLVGYSRSRGGFVFAREYLSQGVPVDLAIGRQWHGRDDMDLRRDHVSREFLLDGIENLRTVGRA